MAEARTRFRSDERTGIAAALAQAKFDRRTQEGLGNMEYAVPIGEVLGRRPIARIGFDPDQYIQMWPGESQKAFAVSVAGGPARRVLGFVDPGERADLISRYEQSWPEGAEHLRANERVTHDPVFLSGAATPGTGFVSGSDTGMADSYYVALHEATHRGFRDIDKGLVDETTKIIRGRYQISKPDIEEIVVRLIDYLNGHQLKSQTAFADKLIYRASGGRIQTLKQMMNDPDAVKMVIGLQGIAERALQEQGRPEGATRFAVDSIPETSDKPPPPEVRTTGPRDRLVAWRGRKKNP